MDIFRSGNGTRGKTKPWETKAGPCPWFVEQRTAVRRSESRSGKNEEDLEKGYGGMGE